MNTTLFSIRLLHSPHSLLHSLSRVFFVVCALFTATASKAEAEFTFTLIADSAGAFRDFDTSSFSLNVSGTVAFFAFLNTGRCGIFTGNGATTTTVVLNPMQLGGYGSPSVNQAGMVVFSDRQGNAIRPQRIVSGNGGALTTIADTVGEFEGFTVGYSTSINSAGTVAFWAVPDTGPAGIFASSGGTVTPLFLNSVSLGVSNNFAFNDAGTLAFRKSNATGIVTVTGGAITTIVDSSGPLNYFGSAPSLNETGTVAFVAGVGVSTEAPSVFTRAMAGR